MLFRSIDSDYVEELFVLLTCLSTVGQWIEPGDRIAQAELVKSEIYTLEETKNIPTVKTNRKGGMGSTGVTINVETITPQKN